MKHPSFAVASMALAIWAARSEAYVTYSQNRDATNCAACHGGFQAPNYVSSHNGTPWRTDLMTGHSNMVGSGGCGTCHQSLSVLFPVSIGTSAGAEGLSPTSCVGCHGRDQDAGHDGAFPGRGAGLRQHHFRAGVQICSPCHADANPADYTPVGENIKPANYFTPDAAHLNKPTDPCNANGSESKFGPAGLDNDGNGIYDLADPACAPAVTPTSTATATLTLAPTATATPPPTATATPVPCVGDCGGDGHVTVDELLLMVNIALGTADLSACKAGDANGDGHITVDEILTAVNNALNGCQ
ncbi:MAG: hypothetical protein ACHQ9S_07025 [Candidatus Binatia bacterium]